VSRVIRERGELRLKIVYAGPGLSGKTTNLRWLHRSLPEPNRGRMVSLATEGERTLFFDFLPVEIENVAGHRLRLGVYTIPGQNRYRANQALILRDADGIVFVADSHPLRREANLRSLAGLDAALSERGRGLGGIPCVFQYNKRDLPGRIPLEELEEDLNPDRRVFIPAVALDGKGVSATLKEITRVVVKESLRTEGLGTAPG
jgi:hypothetical protein